METLFQDLRYGFRMFVKNPGFTAVAVVALALGIGANSAIFSVVNSLLLRPLGFSDPDRLVQLWEANSKVGRTQVPASFPNFADWRDQNHVFENVIAYSSGRSILQAPTGPSGFAARLFRPRFFRRLASSRFWAAASLLKKKGRARTFLYC